MDPKTLLPKITETE